MKILIADDDDASRYLLTCILKSDNHVVVAANDGDEAWSALTEQVRFDLAIFDVMMPGLSGIELLSRVRSDRRFARLPVILCTALNDRNTVNAAVALEINHYIVKPYARTAVLEKVRSVAAEQTHAHALDAAETVCARLGLERDVWQTMLLRLADAVAAWVSEVQQVLRLRQLRPLAMRANAMAGSCVNLGATGLAAQLSAAELALANMETDAASANGGLIGDPLLVSELTSIAEGIRREEKRFRQAIADVALTPAARPSSPG